MLKQIVLKKGNQKNNILSAKGKDIISDYSEKTKEQKVEIFKNNSREINPNNIELEDLSIRKNRGLEKGVISNIDAKIKINTNGKKEGI